MTYKKVELYSKEVVESPKKRTEVKPHYTCSRCGTFMSKRTGPFGKYRYCKT